MRNKSLASYSILGLVGGLLSTTASNADTVYTSFGPGQTYDPAAYAIGGPSFGNQVIASPFVATDTVTLSDAILALRQVSGNSPVNVYIESSSGGAPGTILDTLSQVGSIGSTASLIDFTCSSCSILNAGTLYFLVAQQSNPPNTSGWNESFAHGPTYFDESGSANGPWMVDLPNIGPLGAFEVNGTRLIALSPEPSSIALISAGILGLVAIARRKVLLK